MILAYAYQKIDILFNRKDVDVLSTIDDFHFDDSFSFKYDNGFNIAIGFTAYDNEQEFILDPSYGVLEFRSYEWGARVNEQGEEYYYTERKLLESHLCTREELGLAVEGNPEIDESKSRFFPMHVQTQPIIDFYYKKMLCLGDADLEIHGDYNSMTARQLNV